MMRRISQEDLDCILERTEDCWRTLSEGRVFLTGCTGFFGVWILESFLAARQRFGLSFDLTLLTRNPESFLREFPQFGEQQWIHCHRGEVASFVSPDGEFAHVMHGATTSARETFEKEPPLAKFQTVAMGTRRVLDLCVEKKLEEMLYLGSGAAYGPQPECMPLMAEDCLLAPDTMNAHAALGHAKRTAEFFCAAYANEHGLKIKMTRCFSFLGAYLPLDIHYAVGNFIADGLAGRAIGVRGDGRPVRSYLYMSDAVVWMLTIWLKGKSGRIYNVGSEEAVSIAELANLVGDSFDPPVRVDRPSVGWRAPETAASDRYVPSTLRARTELGLEQTVPLKEGIRKTIEFWR